jgi:hypothetical protein
MYLFTRGAQNDDRVSGGWWTFQVRTVLEPLSLRYPNWGINHLGSYTFTSSYLSNLLVYIITTSHCTANKENQTVIHQAAGRRPLNAEARVRALFSPRGICGGQSGIGIGLPQSSSVLSWHYHSTEDHHSHTSPGWWAVVPLVEVVHRHSLAPSTTTTQTSTKLTKKIPFRAVFWVILPGRMTQKTALNIILAAVRTWNLTMLLFIQMMMEAVRTSETSVDNHFTRQYNPEDSTEHHTRRRENLKSHKRNEVEVCRFLMMCYSSFGLCPFYIIKLLYFKSWILHLSSAKRGWGEERTEYLSVGSPG